MSHVALQDLSENRFQAAELLGKLANIFADLDARALTSTTHFKMLTTGDPITAERKHERPFTFKNYAQMLFSANRMPPSRDRSLCLLSPMDHYPIHPNIQKQGGRQGRRTPREALQGIAWHF